MIKLDLRIFMTLFLFHIGPKLQFKQGVNVIDAHIDNNWIYGLKCDCWFIFVLYIPCGRDEHDYLMIWGSFIKYKVTFLMH